MERDACAASYASSNSAVRSVAEESEARADKASRGINEAADKIAKGAPETGEAVEQGIREAAKQVKEGAPQAADAASEVSASARARA